MSLFPAIPARSFGFTDMKDGARLSGYVSVWVDLPSAHFQYGDVGLLVDGTQDGCGGQIAGRNPLAPVTEIPLDTDCYANGPHTLAVRDNAGRTVTRRVVFDNAISEVDVTPLLNTTNSDGVGAPKSCAIRAALRKPQRWTVRVLGSRDKPVRSFSGRGARIAASWDGRDEAGREVEDNSYTIEIAAGALPPVIDITNKLGLRR